MFILINCIIYLFNKIKIDLKNFVVKINLARLLCFKVYLSIIITRSIVQISLVRILDVIHSLLN